MKGRRGEARLVALIAEEDHAPVGIAADGRIRVTGHRVETPLEDVARYEVRVGEPQFRRSV
jgi:hypothetical protein